jgi:signal transduction histidine kinase
MPTDRTVRTLICVLALALVVAGCGSSKTNPRGAGLGLALARRLARQAGGEVVAEAGAGGGRFTVELPRAPMA